MRLLCAIVVTLAFSACTTVRPHPQPDDLVPFSAQLAAAKGGEAKPKAKCDSTYDSAVKGQELASAKAVVSNYLWCVVTTAESKSKVSWNVGDATFVGAIAAAVGAIADKVGLLNTGGGLAGLGLLGRDRYRWDEKRSIYRRAAGQLSCVHKAIEPFTDDALAILQKYEDPSVRRPATSTIADIGSAVDRIRLQILERLDGISSAPPSAEAIRAAAEQYAKDGATKSAAPAAGIMGKASMGVEELLKQAELVKALKLELMACSS